MNGYENSVKKILKEHGWVKNVQQKDLTNTGVRKGITILVYRMVANQDTLLML